MCVARVLLPLPLPGQWYFYIGVRVATPFFFYLSRGYLFLWLSLTPKKAVKQRLRQFFLFLFDSIRRLSCNWTFSWASCVRIAVCVSREKMKVPVGPIVGMGKSMASRTVNVIAALIVLLTVLRPSEALVSVCCWTAILLFLF